MPMLDQNARLPEDEALMKGGAPSGKFARMRRHWKWRKRAKAIVLVVVCLVLLNHLLILFRVVRMRYSNPATSAMIERRQSEMLADGVTYERKQNWVPYDCVSPSVLRAVIAGEDPTFWRHSGFNWELVQLAIEENWYKKRISRGASTISQQLAKNLFLSPSKNVVRKLHEALITIEMEKILGKRRILELYLNVIEWGEGVYGVEAAARHYFNKSAASLNDEQAALLCAIIPKPRGNYDLSDPPAHVKERVKSILEQMRGIRLPD
jgi:monofunctional biosynthetic peptidoglycan transglycosylase